MKKVVLLVVILMAFGCKQDKIAFVNNVRLMEGFKQKIAVEERFAQQKEAFNKKRDSISRAFQMEAQAIESQINSMTEQKAQEAYGRLQQKGQQIGQALQQQEQQLQQIGQADMDSVVQKVKKEIAAYGKANGYTFILGGGDGGSVLYGEEAKDITDAILGVLNKEKE
jgi:outer membrane protein